MYYPPNFTPEEQLSKDLHEEAGLLFNGVDEDGQQDWLGSQEQWARYDKLVKDFEEYENMA